MIRSSSAGTSGFSRTAGVGAASRMALKMTPELSPRNGSVCTPAQAKLRSRKRALELDLSVPPLAHDPGFVRIRELLQQLDDLRGAFGAGQARRAVEPALIVNGDWNQLDLLQLLQIGRASCRERV